MLDSFLASEALLAEKNNLRKKQLKINLMKNTYQTKAMPTGDAQEAFCFGMQVPVADPCIININNTTIIITITNTTTTINTK
jgi:hypothetical protein